MRFFIHRIILAGLATLSIGGSPGHASELRSVWQPREYSLEQTPLPPDSLLQARGIKAPRGSFRVGETDRILVLDNGRIELALLTHNDQASIFALWDLIRAKPLTLAKNGESPLWKLVLRSPDGALKEITSDNAGPADRSISLDDNPHELRVELVWEVAAPFSDDTGMMKVTVLARLREDEDFVRWGIEVEVPEEGPGGLWQVDFPIVPGPGASGHSDVFYNPYLYQDHAGRIKGQLLSLQFLAVDDLYLAAYDPEHSHKEFELQTGKAFRLQTLVPDAGTSRHYAQAYDFVTGSSAGDWFDAAQLYRTWAEQQAWFGPPIEDRPSAGHARSLATWVSALHPLTSEPHAVVDRMNELRRALGADIGTHWYNWGKRALAPRQFPSRAGFGAAAGELEDSGTLVMPYVNVNYWVRGQRGRHKQAWNEFKQASRYAAGSSDGIAQRQVDGHYLNYVRDYEAVPMCRATTFWRQYLTQQIQRLRSESQASAIYLDMAATPPRWRCFDTGHGHPAGGGRHWAGGTESLLREVRDSVGTEVLLAAEGRFEGAIPYVDLDLVHYWWGTQAYAPAWEAVYSEQRLEFASVDKRQSPDAIIVKSGTRWLYGARPRVGDWILEPAYAEVLHFLTKLAGLTQSASDFLDTGRLLRAPAWSVEPNRLVIDDWRAKKRGALVQVSTPQMERAAWRLADGSIAVLVANFGQKAAQAVLRLDHAWIGNSNPVMIDADGARSIAPLDDTTLTVRVPGRDVRAFVFKPGSDDA